MPTISHIMLQQNNMVSESDPVKLFTNELYLSNFAASEYKIYSK